MTTPAEHLVNDQRVLFCRLHQLLLWLVALTCFACAGVPDAPQDAATETFTLNDGSILTVNAIAAAPDWACGSRKTGQVEVPGQGNQPVTIYFDRAGHLFSINATMGNLKLYDATNGRECLMNWTTNQNELLTNEQYEQYERQAGKAKR